MKNMSKKKKILLISFASIAILLVVGFAGLCIYASDFRTLDEEYFYIFDEENVIMQDDMVVFLADSDVGIVFYPGGRVEYISYAPLAQKLQQQGYNVFLVDMPFNMANFGVNKADGIIEEYTEISNWYIAGHSLGGVAGNMYAVGNEDKINGLIFLGIYLSQDYDLEDTITIVGSNDLRVGDSITYTTNVHIIEGGNHAQFGNYGKNEGDGEATISAEEQQNEAVALIAEFIEEKNK